jgi:hypothetical protein
VKPVTGVDKDGKPVEDSEDLVSGFFVVNATSGQVLVAQPLDRNVAASVTMRIQVN